MTGENTTVYTRRIGASVKATLSRTSDRHVLGDELRE